MKIFNNTIYSRFLHQTTTVLIAIAFMTSMVLPKIVSADNEPLMDMFNTTPILATPVPEVKQELTPKEWVLARVAEAGLNPAEAEAIITCESRWNPDAMGVNNNRSVDLGLWQINSIHKDISNADKLDYQKATDWAISKRLKDGHWKAWHCSRKLAYLKK
ncbi:MAG: hypothetical protein US42_C0019G0007 [Candidatus Magasanikbacteria bacterium GW2011_GWC2_37_14]|uniref:Transglycosylase SLT domain-containing protein n=1 Tax=Candidatus Magasanikbacteria bacterium GW2011_GWC2_37_14 TaxID=1619046 RepID=A0A0G0GA92_9BACT|nr:MAG: hypothetical protein US42_C0019G0007 [Candidatus Magasanikbacteria bacterium GW2011_GWC2_37_14]